MPSTGYGNPKVCSTSKFLAGSYWLTDSISGT